jgi:hypothetical protein
MSFLKIIFTNKNVFELKQELEIHSHVVEYKYIKGKDFKENMLFLEESLLKPLVLLIEEKEYINIKNILLNLLNANLKLYVMENKINNIHTFDILDKYYLD